jgi:ABC-type branched-subunit amino acid transport system substrate-binding protein
MQNMKIRILILSVITLAAALTIPNMFGFLFPPVPKACDLAMQNNPHLSCGEKVLLIPPGGKSRVNKQKGFDIITEKNYASAIPYLDIEWKVARDPETSIALENAKIANDDAAKVKTIAVVIPASQTPIFVPTSILKGVAHAQSAWNQNPSQPWKLRVVIADDANDPIQAKAVAQELLKRPDILAVVGHYSSQVTTSVQSLYQQATTVLISGTSTATELTTEQPDTFFFRTCSSNKIAGVKMAQTWAKQHQKIAIFYTPSKKFSESIRGAFLDHLSSVQVVKEFSLSNPAHAKTEIEIAKKLGATGIVLFPDAYTDPIERDRVLSLIKANDGRLPILGNEIIADDYLFKLAPKLINNLTISLPWHPSDLAHQDAQLFQTAPNWWGAKSNLNSRIVMSYDAVKVLLAAIDRLPRVAMPAESRVQLQQLLSPNFKTTGMTGTIQFNGSDRSTPINSLVRPICNLTTCNGFKPAF